MTDRGLTLIGRIFESNHYDHDCDLKKGGLKFLYLKNSIELKYTVLLSIRR
jgi:hypothetical protein